MSLLNLAAVAGNAIESNVNAYSLKNKLPPDENSTNIYGVKNKRLFAGRTAKDAKRHLEKLVQFGQLHRCHYLVSMQPYLPQHAFLDTPMQELLGASLDDDKAIWHLVTQTNLPIMQTDTDSVKAGSFLVNRITGQQPSEIQMTFLDTGDGLVLNAMTAAKDAKFLPNGLQRVPAQTAIRVRLKLFNRAWRESIAYSSDFLVEVQAVEPLSLAGNDGSPVEVQVTFMQLDPFMR